MKTDFRDWGTLLGKFKGMSEDYIGFCKYRIARIVFRFKCLQ